MVPFALLASHVLLYTHERFCKECFTRKLMDAGLPVSEIAIEVNYSGSKPASYMPGTRKGC